MGTQMGRKVCRAAFASSRSDLKGRRSEGRGRLLLSVQVGNGANMKLVINMVMGTMMASFAEGLLLAKKAGLRQEDFIEVRGTGVSQHSIPQHDK